MGTPCLPRPASDTASAHLRMALAPVLAALGDDIERVRVSVTTEGAVYAARWTLPPASEVGAPASEHDVEARVTSLRALPAAALVATHDALVRLVAREDADPTERRHWRAGLAALAQHDWQQYTASDDVAHEVESRCARCALCRHQCPVVTGTLLSTATAYSVDGTQWVRPSEEPPCRVKFETTHERMGR